MHIGAVINCRVKHVEFLDLPFWVWAAAEGNTEEGYLWRETQVKPFRRPGDTFIGSRGQPEGCS